MEQRRDIELLRGRLGLSALATLGFVRAEGPRADRGLEVTSELGVLSGDLLDRLADAPLHSDAGAFGS
jgi:hypothetical protein